MKAGFSVWTTYLYVLRSESCNISYFSANLVMHLKLCFVFIQNLALSTLEKLFRIPHLPYGPTGSCVCYFRQFPFHISVITSHCFLQGSRLLLHKGYRLSLHKKEAKERGKGCLYARDSGSTPGLGRSPGGGHSNPLQYSCLENPMDRRA